MTCSRAKQPTKLLSKHDSQQDIVALPTIVAVQTIVLLVVQHLCRDVWCMFAVAGRVKEPCYEGLVCGWPLQGMRADVYNSKQQYS